MRRILVTTDKEKANTYLVDHIGHACRDTFGVPKIKDGTLHYVCSWNVADEHEPAVQQAIQDGVLFEVQNLDDFTEAGG